MKLKINTKYYYINGYQIYEFEVYGIEWKHRRKVYHTSLSQFPLNVDQIKRGVFKTRLQAMKKIRKNKKKELALLELKIENIKKKNIFLDGNIALQEYKEKSDA